jgi:hypothetical protein
VISGHRVAPVPDVRPRRHGRVRGGANFRARASCPASGSRPRV